jgi:hypothetical protein
MAEAMAEAVLSNPYNAASRTFSLKKLQSSLSPELMRYLSKPETTNDEQRTTNASPGC